LEAVYKSGKAKAIGISNFSKAELERLLQHAKVTPAVHQLELHPWLQQYDFLEWHKSQGIHVTAYSPFGNSNEIYDKGKKEIKLIEEPTLVEIGRKYGKSGAQVALRWGIERGHSVIPKSKTESRIQQNGELDFELTKEDIEKISKIDRKLRLNDPSGNFGWNFYADLDGKH
jgi:alcohol dehydrogenase (NADP+)